MEGVQSPDDAVLGNPYYGCGEFCECPHCKSNWRPPPLPKGRNIDGRPVWEPPIFNYSHLIDEEYEKKREAVLKHYNGDVVQTTSLLDTETEGKLLNMFYDWTIVNLQHAEEMSDWRRRAFFLKLYDEVFEDSMDVSEEQGAIGLRTRKRKDGTYRVGDFYATSPEHDSDDNEGESAPEISSIRSREPILASPEDEEGSPAPALPTPLTHPYLDRLPAPSPLAFLLQFAHHATAKHNPSDSSSSNESAISTDGDGNEDVD